MLIIKNYYYYYYKIINMKFYNNKNGIILVCFLFILWFIYICIFCPCNIKTIKKCTRFEIYGVQLNHLIFFIVIGIFFPSFFYTWMLLGIIWEIFEFILDLYPNIVIKYIGGCLSYPPKNIKNNKNISKGVYIYRNQTKYMNPIDRFFGIKHSKIHGWNGSIAEVIPNILGFTIGSYINIYYNKYKNSII